MSYAAGRIEAGDAKLAALLEAIEGKLSY